MAIRRGTASTDYMFGTSSADTFYGYGGDDYLYGYADHFVQGDTNGDGFADFMIEVNAASPARTDFLL